MMIEVMVPLLIWMFVVLVAAVALRVVIAAGIFIALLTRPLWWWGSLD